MNLCNTKLWALLLVLSLICLLFSRRKRTNLNPKRLPPCPSPTLPILGNLLTLVTKGKPHKTLAELASVYGPIMTLKLGSLTSIIISCPKLAKFLLQNHNLALSTRFVPDSVRAQQHDQFSPGWLPASSTKWRTFRKIFKHQLFSNQRLDAIQDRHLQVVDNLIEYVREHAQCGVPLDITQAMFHTSFNFMLASIFSMNSSHPSSREIMNLLCGLIKEIGAPNLGDFFPLLKMVDPQRIKYRLTILCRKLFKVFEEIIEARLKVRKERTSLTSCMTNDFLDTLMDEERVGTLTRQDILHLLLDLFGAGADTTSTTLEWAMTELIGNPSVLRKAQEEMDTHEAHNKSKAIIHDSHLFDLPYLQAIVKETFRLHPPTPLLIPYLVQEDIEICGFTIPKDAQLLVNAWAIGRDPRVWPNPKSFQPERFLGSEVDVKGQHFELIPFGSGPRICPGLPLASRTIHLVLAELIKSFNWVLEGGEVGKGIDMDDEYGDRKSVV